MMAMALDPLSEAMEGLELELVNGDLDGHVVEVAQDIKIEDPDEELSVVTFNIKQSGITVSDVDHVLSRLPPHIVTQFKAQLQQACQVDSTKVELPDEKNIINDIEQSSTVKLKNLQVKKLRSLVPKLMMVCYLPKDEWEQKEKVKNLWDRRPVGYPDDVLFIDPNNGKKVPNADKILKPKRDDLEKMYNVLLKVYQQKKNLEQSMPSTPSSATPFGLTQSPGLPSPGVPSTPCVPSDSYSAGTPYMPSDSYSLSTPSMPSDAYGTIDESALSTPSVPSDDSSSLAEEQIVATPAVLDLQSYYESLVTDCQHKINAISATPGIPLTVDQQDKMLMEVLRLIKNFQGDDNIINGLHCFHSYLENHLSSVDSYEKMITNCKALCGLKTFEDQPQVATPTAAQTPLTPFDQAFASQVPNLPVMTLEQPSVPQVVNNDVYLNDTATPTNDELTDMVCSMAIDYGTS